MDLDDADIDRLYERAFRAELMLLAPPAIDIKQRLAALYRSVGVVPDSLDDMKS